MTEVRCIHCGTFMPTNSAVCPRCGNGAEIVQATAIDDGPVLRASLADDPMNNAGMRMLLPVGRSAYAIIAGYLGLFSVLIIFAPFALLFGILAVRDIRKFPEKHGMGRAIFGIVMGGLGTLALAAGLIAMGASLFG